MKKVVLIVVVMMQTSYSMHKRVSRAGIPCCQPVLYNNTSIKSAPHTTMSTYYDVSRYDYYYPYLGGYWGNPYGYWGYDYYPYNECSCVGIGLDAWGSDTECYPY